MVEVVSDSSRDRKLALNQNDPLNKPYSVLQRAIPSHQGGATGGKNNTNKTSIKQNRMMEHHIHHHHHHHHPPHQNDNHRHSYSGTTPIVIDKQKEAGKTKEAGDGLIMPNTTKPPLANNKSDSVAETNASTMLQLPLENNGAGKKLLEKRANALPVSSSSAVPVALQRRQTNTQRLPPLVNNKRTTRRDDVPELALVRKTKRTSNKATPDQQPNQLMSISEPATSVSTPAPIGIGNIHNKNNNNNGKKCSIPLAPRTIASKEEEPAKHKQQQPTGNKQQPFASKRLAVLNPTPHSVLTDFDDQFKRLTDLYTETYRLLAKV